MMSPEFGSPNMEMSGRAFFPAHEYLRKEEKETISFCEEGLERRTR